jgi:tetratricopeptide (TPR) repeat protein
VTRFVLARLGVVVVLAALIALRRVVPGVLAAWLSYLALLSPNSGLVLTGSHIAADRYGFIAMIPLVAVAAAGLAATFETFIAARATWALAPLLVVLAAVLGLEVHASRRQCLSWHDSLALLNVAYQRGGAHDTTVLNNLGYCLALEGRNAEALPYLEEAVRRSPRSATVRHSLGAALAALGRTDDARRLFQEALRLNPRHEASRRDLARLPSGPDAGKRTDAPAP